MQQATISSTRYYLYHLISPSIGSFLGERWGNNKLQKRSLQSKQKCAPPSTYLTMQSQANKMSAMHQIQKTELRGIDKLIAFLVPDYLFTYLLTQNNAEWKRCASATNTNTHTHTHTELSSRLQFSFLKAFVSASEHLCQRLVTQWLDWWVYIVSWYCTSI